jgi:hypothetical protein
MLKNLTADWPCDIMFFRNLFETKGSYFTNTTMPSLAVILYVGSWNQEPSQKPFPDYMLDS